MPDLIEVASLPVGRDKKLTRAEWTRIEAFLDQWQRETEDAIKKLPARSYELGKAQAHAFQRLLEGIGQASVPPATPGQAPTSREARYWAERYSFHEVHDSLNKYVGKIKDELLYGLREAWNPTQVGAALYRATHDQTVNWRAIARTEMARANAAGRLTAIENMGYDRVWVMPHHGACKHCRRILELQDFAIADVRDATNRGRGDPSNWVACIPLHPFCRHGWLPYDKEIADEYRAEHAKLTAAGLTDDDRLDEMFDDSGQIKPEYAGEVMAAMKTPDLIGVFGKTRAPSRNDLLMAPLAMAIEKVRKDRAPSRQGLFHLVDVDDLRTDLYQRAIEPGKVIAMAHAAGKLPAPDVSQRPDGTLYVLDGQHRVEVAKLRKRSQMLVRLYTGLTWEQELAMCHGADDGAVEETTPSDLVGKTLDPLVFHEHRLRKPVADRLHRWWLHAFGQDAVGWSHPYLTGCPTCVGAGEPNPAFDLRIAVDYKALRASRKEWRKLTDGELHLALTMLARTAAAAGDLVPGMDVQVLVMPEVSPAIYAARDHTEAVWDLSADRWLNPPPAPFEPGEIPTDWQTDADRASELLWELLHGYGSATDSDTAADYRAALVEACNALDRHRGSDRTEFIWQHALTHGPLGQALALGKSIEELWPGCTIKAADGTPVAKAEANTGVEHWITVHPNGDGEKGQPVLVRNNADGTMTVIGGAGGNLNLLRLDPKRRIKPEEGDKAKGEARKEQPLTEAEAQQAAEERERQVQTAQAGLAKVKEAQARHKDEMFAFVREQTGIDLNDPDLDSDGRRRLLAKLRTSAARTLAFGGISRRDSQDGADAEQLDLGDEDAPKALPGANDEPADEKDSGERTPRPSVAMDDEQAKAMLDYFLDQSRLSRAGSQHRKVISGDAQASDANQIDWSSGGQEQRDERRAKAVEQQARTDLSRTLLEHGDEQHGRGGYNTHYKRAFQQGGYDSVDAFSHSILGEAVLSRPAYNLLGVSGAAQLVAHTVQQKAQEVGKDNLDLDKVQASLKELTDEQERTVNERGLARVQTAVARAAEATQELKASEKGESLYTTTMARSIATAKAQEAKRSLGMMIGGLEATSAMKVALDRKAGEKIKVGGFATAAQIKDLADRAKVKIGAGDIVRQGPGNYTLQVEPERLAGLIRPEPKGDEAKRGELKGIRTAADLDREVQAQRTGPGMSDTLDENQARGKMFLDRAGSGVLAFDPGVGKTHVAIAQAMQLMHDQPGKHKCLIVAPTNMARSWANTIQSQGSGHSVQVVGQHEGDASKDTSSTKTRKAQLGRGADFTIISYESLRSYQKELADKGEDTHSIVVADELQKAKNEKTGLHKGVEAAVQHARDAHGDDAHFYGLTGTPIEKDVGDLHAMVRLAKMAKGEPHPDRKTYGQRYGKLGQDEHVARGDRLQQFRQGLDEDLFRLSAQDAGNDLGTPGRTRHQVKLTDEHKQALQERVKGLNDQIADYHQAKAEGRQLPALPNFGGRQAILDSLYNHPGSALVKKTGDLIDSLGTFKHKGGEYTLPDGSPDPDDHAGEYEHKAVVFGALENSKALFGENWNKPGKQPPGGVHAELEARGHKVFVGHGSMSSAENEKAYKAFLAHKGKATFLTNDKNNAGISLQFGDNKGQFQHGATHMVHFTRPVNNATIQQREARILRKGSQASFDHEGKKVPAAYHTLSADTPVEQRLDETLEREARTQDLAGTSEQLVSGKQTLQQRLAAKGVKT